MRSIRLWNRWSYSAVEWQSRLKASSRALSAPSLHLPAASLVRTSTRVRCEEGRMAADHRLKGAFVRKLLTVGCGRAYMVARQNGNNSEPRSRPVPRVRGGRAYWESPSGSLSWHRARACTCFLKIQRVGRTTQSSATSNLPVKPCFPLPQMDPPVAGACFFSRSFAMASRRVWMGEQRVKRAAAVLGSSQWMQKREVDTCNCASFSRASSASLELLACSLRGNHS